MLNITKCLRDTGGDGRYFHSVEWLHFIEENLFYLKENKSIMDVQANDAWVFRHDLTGYLYHMGVPLMLHYPIMRLMGWTSGTEFTEDVRYLFSPSQTRINELMSKRSEELSAT